MYCCQLVKTSKDEWMTSKAQIIINSDYLIVLCFCFPASLPCFDLSFIFFSKKRKPRSGFRLENCLFLKWWPLINSSTSSMHMRIPEIEECLCLPFGVDILFTYQKCQISIHLFLVSNCVSRSALHGDFESSSGSKTTNLWLKDSTPRRPCKVTCWESLVVIVSLFVLYDN